MKNASQDQEKYIVTIVDGSIVPYRPETAKKNDFISSDSGKKNYFLTKNKDGKFITLKNKIGNYPLLSMDEIEHFLSKYKIINRG
jgi:hypothetical protein